MVRRVELALNARCDRLLQDMEVWRSKLADLESACEANEATLHLLEGKIQESTKVAFKSMEKQGIRYGELAARVHRVLQQKEAAAAEQNREMNERLQGLRDLAEAVKECAARVEVHEHKIEANHELLEEYRSDPMVIEAHSNYAKVYTAVNE